MQLVRRRARLARTGKRLLGLLLLLLLLLRGAVVQARGLLLLLLLLLRRRQGLRQLRVRRLPFQALA